MDTLRFAIRARCGPKPSSQQIDDMVRNLAQLVGLSHALNTNVGDSYVRGVSGGERRRVSLAEALATCARYVFYKVKRPNKYRANLSQLDLPG